MMEYSYSDCSLISFNGEGQNSMGTNRHEKLQSCGEGCGRKLEAFIVAGTKYGKPASLGCITAYDQLVII